MASVTRTDVPLRHPDRLFINGVWERSSSDAEFVVVDPATELAYFSAAEASAADMDRAIGAARRAFDDGPWPRLSHTERAQFIRRIADGLRARSNDLAEIWPRESGVLHSMAQGAAPSAADTLDFYAGLSTTFAWETPMPSTVTDFGLLVREPVGVVGAIVPWNGALNILAYKVAPALIAGCTVILKSSPEAPGEAYVLAEIAEAVGLPPGVLNVITADREVSEQLVRDDRVDKISFTGSTAAGRRIASLCGERMARCTTELGGKSAAVILDDYDLAVAAEVIAAAECRVSGQVCSSVTRIVVQRSRHDALVEALADRFGRVRVGDPLDSDSEMGPLAVRRQRDRVESYIAYGLEDGATLATGGGRPAHLDRGWYVEPTVFGNVDWRSRIAQEEIFGPVLVVIPADDEQDAIRIANSTAFGLNGSVFTNDVDRARSVASQFRSGTVGHNTVRGDLAIAFGGVKQSGIGREGGVEGLMSYLESKTVLLQGPPSLYNRTK